MVSGQSTSYAVKIKMEKEVRRLQSENQQFKTKMPKKQGSKCKQMVKSVQIKKKMNHFGKLDRCSSKEKENHHLVRSLVLMNLTLKACDLFRLETLACMQPFGLFSSETASVRTTGEHVHSKGLLHCISIRGGGWMEIPGLP